ncbi:MAG: Hsp33 family molecular chaperone HslO, partial [Aeromonas sp.]
NAMIHELGSIDMHCDYCGAQYQFNEQDVERLFSDASGNNANQLH